MRTVNEEARRQRQIEIMETTFDCYAENGFSSVGTKAIAKACGCNSATLYQYFDNLDDLIVKSTEYCMSKVEDEFMAKAPTDVEDLWRFIDEIPYWTAKKHGKKYRLMYQIYTHPKYREYGQKFFKGVDKRYAEYAKSLEPKLGIPYEKITPLIFILIRALSLIHISEPTRRVVISYAVFCLKKFFFNDTATTEIYTRLVVGSVRCV